MNKTYSLLFLLFGVIFSSIVFLSYFNQATNRLDLSIHNESKIQTIVPKINTPIEIAQVIKENLTSMVNSSHSNIINTDGNQSKKFEFIDADKVIYQVDSFAENSSKKYIEFVDADDVNSVLSKPSKSQKQNVEFIDADEYFSKIDTQN